PGASSTACGTTACCSWYTTAASSRPSMIRATGGWRRWRRWPMPSSGRGCRTWSWAGADPGTSDVKTPEARRMGWQLLVTLLLAMAAVGWSSPSGAAEPALPAGWTAIAPERLDAMRGGYALPSGLVVSFGFERQAWVNGELVVSLQVDIPDVGAMTEARAHELAKLGEVQRDQGGPRNLALPGGASPGGDLQNAREGRVSEG